MNKKPLVTVFTPVYNCGEYLQETIESVLNQTFTDFEYLLVDDCSTDNSVAIIEQFSDPRIRLIKNRENKGISYNRNLGIEKSNGKYLAMLDGDDIALDTRLEKQIEFLERNPDYGILGTSVINMDSSGTPFNQDIQFGIPDEQIPSRMLFNNYIYTSSATINKNYLTDDLRFKEEFVVAEDYELWIRLIRNCKIGIIREKLIKYRIHDSSISNQKKQLMIDTERILIERQLNELNCELTNEELQAFIALSKEDYIPYLNKYTLINSTLTKLIFANKTSKVFESIFLKKLIFNYWHVFFLNIKSYNPVLIYQILSNGMFRLLTLQEKLFFCIKCLILKKSDS